MKILFLCEAVTLSHLVRPLQLALGLCGHDILLASTFFPEFLSDELGRVTTQKILNGVSAADFQRKLYEAKTTYTEDVIESYIKQDSRIIDDFRPDVVVSDFRLSAAISCKLKNVPLITLSNIIWSPYANQKMPVPEGVFTDRLGVMGSWVLMNAFRPFIFDGFIKPMNRVRKKYNLNKVKSIYELYSGGDYVAYLDIEGMVSHGDLPLHHCYLGPVLYSAKRGRPSWYDQFVAGANKVIAGMGSSGQSANTKIIIQALEEMSLTAAVAGVVTGREDKSTYSKKVFTEEMLDLIDLLPESDIFIGNGGSPSNYLAFSRGVPVIGVPYNLDQYLSVQCVENLGAGLHLRSGMFTKQSVQKAVEKILLDDSYKKSAKILQSKIKEVDVHNNFKDLLMRAVQS